jgi:hypothetical protein
LLLLAVLTGCGSGRHATAHKTTARASSARHVAFSVQPPALVTLRQYSPESLLWQVVSVKAGGKGVLTTLIGEITGAVRKSFQLPAPQAAVLRRLVADARSVRPPPRSDPRAVFYTLHISGGAAANIQGRMPRRLAALVHFLSGLMLTYCC